MRHATIALESIMDRFLTGPGRLIAILAGCLAAAFAPSPAVAGPLATTAFAYNNGTGPYGGSWRGTAMITGPLLETR
jgi:hypothetical protein